MNKQKKLLKPGEVLQRNKKIPGPTSGDIESGSGVSLIPELPTSLLPLAP